MSPHKRLLAAKKTRLATPRVNAQGRSRAATSSPPPGLQLSRDPAWASASSARPRPSLEGALPALCPGSGSATTSLSESRCSSGVLQSREVVLAAFFLALERFPPAGGRAATEVRDEHHVCGHAAHRVYLGVHGPSRRG